MSIIARDIRAADLEECFDVIRLRPYPGGIYRGPELTREELDTWRNLLERESTMGGIVENLEQPRGRRIIAFGFAGFVCDSWFERYLRAPFPYYGSWISARIRQGRDDVVLTAEQMRRANSEKGLNGAVLHMGWNSSRLPSEITFEAKQSMVAAFTNSCAGFRIRHMISEVVCEFEANLHLANATWRLRSRYDSYYSSQGVSKAPAYPLLLGISREEAQTAGNDISVLAPLFVWRDVRFCFSPNQQKLLHAARSHDSDKELADTLGITPNALARRLDRLYKRVLALQGPDTPVFPHNVGMSAKRRLLLQYLAEHPEELRPHNFRKPTNVET